MAKKVNVKSKTNKLVQKPKKSVHKVKRSTAAPADDVLRPGEVLVMRTCDENMGALKAFGGPPPALFRATIGILSPFVVPDCMDYCGDLEMQSC